MSERIYGIDLGTTNSVVCLWEDDKIVRKTGLVASVVNLETGEAGNEMKKLLRTANNSKLKSSFKVDILQESSVMASTMVLKELKRQVPEMRKVVISVPAYFSAVQRQNTMKAAKEAGLIVVRLINEPTAAAIHFCRNKRSLCIVYDLGGGTFDISVIDARSDAYAVLVTDGLPIGGDQMNRAISNFSLRRQGVLPNQLSETKLRQLEEVAEQAKIQFQKTGEEVTLPCPFISSTFDVKLNLTDYAHLLMVAFSKTIARTQKVMREAGYQPDELKLVFVGGSTHDPYLRNLICSETGLTPANETIDPDYAVAEGAAYFAHLVETGKVDRTVSDITKAIGIRLSNGTIARVVDNNAVLPFEGSIVVSNDHEASGLSLEVYQGNALVAKDNAFLGMLNYDYSERQDAYMGIVEVKMFVDTSGNLTVKANEMGGLEKSITLKL